MRGSKSSGRRDGDLVLQGRDFLFGVSEKFGKKTEVMLAQHCECTKCLLKMSKMVNLTLDGHNTTFLKKKTLYIAIHRQRSRRCPGGWQEQKIGKLFHQNNATRVLREILM